MTGSDNSEQLLDEGLDRRLSFLLVFLVCLAVSFRPLGSGMTMELGSNLVLHIVIFFAVVLWLMRAALTGKMSYRSGSVAGAALVFLLVCVVWTAAAPHKMPAILTLISWTTDILLLLLVLQTTDQGARRTVLTCLLASAAVAVCLGVSQYFWGFDELREIIERDPARVRRQLGITKEMWPTFMARATNREIFGTFVYPNALAGFLDIMLPVAGGLFIGVALSLKRPVTSESIQRSGVVSAGTLTAVMAVCLILTRSKGGWIAVTPAVAYVFFATVCDTTTKKTAAGTAGAVLLVLTLFLANVNEQPVLSQIRDSFSVRIGYWESALRIAKDNYFVGGEGLKGFANQYAMYKKPYHYEVRLAHSTLFQLLVDTGIAGVISYGILWFLLMRDAIRPGRTEEPSARYRWAGISAGAAAFLLLMLALDISPFTEDGGGIDYRTWFGYLLLWVVAFLALERLVVLKRKAVRIGLTAGCLGFLVHGMVDFDMFVPGVHQAALIAAACASGAPVRTRVLSKLYKAGVLIVCISASALIALWLRGMLPGPDIIGGEDLRKQGRYLLAEGKNAEALKALEQAARLNPLDDDVSGTLRGLYFDMWKNGVRTLRGIRTIDLANRAGIAAIRANPYSSSHRMNLAEVIKAQDTEEAIELAREGIRLYPTKPANHILLGDLLSAAGRKEEALREYKEAVRLNGLVNEPWLKLEEDDIRKAAQ